MPQGIVSDELARKLATQAAPATEAFRGLAGPEGLEVHHSSPARMPAASPETSLNPTRSRDLMMLYAGERGNLALPPAPADSMQSALMAALTRATDRRNPNTLVTLQEALAEEHRGLVGGLGRT